MSRIGNKPINLPKEVKYSKDGTKIIVEGPKGKLDLNVDPQVVINKNGDYLELSIERNEKKYIALKGLYRVLLSNIVKGVTSGYEKKLEIIGTGYKASVQGKKIIINVGFSHPIEYEIPEGIKIVVDENTKITITGIDKQMVGQVASNIRRFRPPEPYKGKGIKYSDEVIKRKAGKAAK